MKNQEKINMAASVVIPNLLNIVLPLSVHPPLLSSIVLIKNRNCLSATI